MRNGHVLPLLLMLSVLLLFTPNAFSEETVMRVAPRPLAGIWEVPDVTLNPITVDIVIENGKNVAGYQILLQFNAAYLTYDGIQHGGFLPEGAFFGEPKIINIDSTDPAKPIKAVRFAATSFTGESNGYGNIATITFESRSASKSPLTLLAGPDGTVLSNRTGDLTSPRLEPSATYTVKGKVDLVVESVEARPINSEETRQNYSKGEEFELHATVRNRGNMTTAATTLTFSGPTLTNPDPITIIGLEPHRAIDISLPNVVTAPNAPGTYIYEASVNRGQSVNPVIWEKSEDLNNNSAPVEITAEELPDLIVESVEVNKTKLRPGKLLTLTVTLKNVGFGPANAPIYYRWHRSTHPNTQNLTSNEWELEASKEISKAYKATKPLAWDTLVPVTLGVGDSSGHPVVLTVPEQPGTYYYHVCVESPLPETNPENNCSDVVEITVEQLPNYMELLNALIKNENDSFTLGADVNGDDKLNYLDENTVMEVYDDGEYENSSDINNDGKVDNIDLQLVQFALKLDVNKNGWIDGEDANMKYDVNEDGVVNDQDQFLVNTAVKYSLKKTLHDWAFPENLISQVAYGENSTYFVFTPGMAQNDNNVVGYKNTITLHIPGTRKIINWDQPLETRLDWDESLDKLLDSLPKDYPYFMFLLETPRERPGEIEDFTDAANVEAIKNTIWLVVDIASFLAGFIPGVGEAEEGWKVLVRAWNLTRSIYSLIRSAEANLREWNNLSKEEQELVISFLTLFAPPQVTIRDPSMFFPHQYGKEKNIIDDSPSFLIMVPNKRLQSIEIEMRQHFVSVSGERPTNGVSLKYFEEPWKRIEIKYPDGVIVIVQPLYTTPDTNVFKRFIESSLDSTQFWMYENAEDKEAAEENTKKILTNLLDVIQNTPLSQRFAREMDGNEFFAPFLDAQTIGFDDYSYWVLGHTLAAPSAHTMSLEEYAPFQQLSPEIKEYLLQHFEGTANLHTLHPEMSEIPEKTSLLPNYPNPFNPETWIPYQLAKSADVTLTIYDIRGHVVRKLDLGHQRAGIYQNRVRAAHWDGKNAVGEHVASGVYFYTLQAGDFSATRKMLIRK